MKLNYKDDFLMVNRENRYLALKARIRTKQQDNSENRYLTLKVRVTQQDSLEQRDDQEIAVSNYLDDQSLDHPGDNMIRPILDSFDIVGPGGTHKCLLYQPLWWSFAAFLDILPNRRFPRDLLQQNTQFLLSALDYLHKCNVVHTSKLSSRSDFI